MFLDIDRHNPADTAAIDENGERLSYGDLCAVAKQMSRVLEKRALVFTLCKNTLGSLVGYISFVSNGTVPLLLDAAMENELVERLIAIYQPAYIWAPADRERPRYRSVFRAYGYELLQTGCELAELHDELAVLVTTSGSTGSPKLVRQSYKNIESNTDSIIEYLGIDRAERPVTTLPMNYVYGTSVINSHLKQGATLLLTTKGLMQKDFWRFLREERATSIAGVPYTYEMLKKLRFTTMKLPDLRTMTQAGGKLLPSLHQEFAQFAADSHKDLLIMYGAAEATARMGYLPPEKSLEKYGGMGVAIPGGRFELVDDEGRIIEEANKPGELVYYGENVTLGYAECGADLAKGDERGGRLVTGDLATRDEERYYTIVGRKKRFLKIFGNRVGLDETERLIKARFQGIECACCGVDDKMYIFVTDGAPDKEIRAFVAGYTSLNAQAFSVKLMETIPKNDAGKILYAKLEEYYE